MKQSKAPIISFSPVVLPVAGHHVDLEMKVSAPASGNNLPVILISMGMDLPTFSHRTEGMDLWQIFLRKKGL